jgi:hypothetical protein
MNDDELITSVRESFTGVRSATPVERIVSRSRAVRARRRTPALAGAAAVLAGTALAVTTLLPSGHPGVQGSRHSGSPLANARLAAWTVAKQTNGNIDVTIRQLKNPAGLQRTLRADGLPVNVTFSGHSQNASCQPYPASNDVLRGVARLTPGARFTGVNNAFLVINPSVLPSGAGLAIYDRPRGGTGPVRALGGNTSTGLSEFRTSPNGHTREIWVLYVSVVYASQQCTG